MADVAVNVGNSDGGGGGVNVTVNGGAGAWSQTHSRSSSSSSITDEENDVRMALDPRACRDHRVGSSPKRRRRNNRQSRSKLASRAHCFVCGETLACSLDSHGLPDHHVSDHATVCRSKVVLADQKVKRSRHRPTFYVQITSDDVPVHWMLAEVDAESTLDQFDEFLRHAWLECCMHGSRFELLEQSPLNKVIDRERKLYRKRQASRREKNKSASKVNLSAWSRRSLGEGVELWYYKEREAIHLTKGIQLHIEREMCKTRLSEVADLGALLIYRYDYNSIPSTCRIRVLGKRRGVIFPPQGIEVGLLEREMYAAEDSWDGDASDECVRVIMRNAAPELTCSVCHKMSVPNSFCVECRDTWLCSDECVQQHEKQNQCDIREFANTPRLGMCHFE